MESAWLNVRETAEYLRCSVSLVRRLVAENQIPYRRIPDGKLSKILFNRKQLDLWLLCGSQNPSKRQRLTFESIL